MIYYCTHLKIKFFVVVKPRRLVVPDIAEEASASVFRNNMDSMILKMGALRSSRTSPTTSRDGVTLQELCISVNTNVYPETYCGDLGSSFVGAGSRAVTFY
jgi:hypothetical protein